MKINFTRTASNQHISLRKIVNFVRSKCYPENISKNNGKKANCRKSCQNFKIIEKLKRGDMMKNLLIDNDGKLLIPQYHSIFLESNTHLRSLNSK